MLFDRTPATGLLLTHLLFLIGFCSTAATITVGSGGDFPNLEAAESSIQAGDTIIVLNGTYSDGTQLLSNLNGTESAPIIIKAETENGAVFSGGTEAVHLTNCSHLVLDGLKVTAQTGNGINIDDGGDYSTPTHNITVMNCVFENMNSSGNSDFLKLSGLDTFLVKNCTFINGGGGGSGVDMVGCHQGVIEDCTFDQAGVTGIQAKGGTQYILIRRNIFRDIEQRAVNLGGSTGLSFFRPPLPDPITNAFEAADLEVYSNVLIRSWAPVAYVGCVRVKVYHNTIFKPQNWAIRILQETTEPGFLSCADNEFINNIVYLEEDITEVNIGPNTNPTSFIFSSNLWFNESNSSWSPVLPVTDPNQIIADPIFQDTLNGDFRLLAGSPAIGAGMTLAEPQTDFLENNYQNPPSIGAFEGDLNVGTAKVESQPVRIYPNPTRGWTHIQLKETPRTTASVKIYNASGELIQTLEFSAQVFSIDLNILPKGIYVLQVDVDSKMITKQLAVQ